MENKKFKQAVDLLVKEKGIDEDTIYDAMELALTSAYKKNYNSLSNVRVEINRSTGEIHVYSYKTVVDKEEENKYKKFSDIDFSTINEDDEEDDGGEVLIQKIRESEKYVIFEEFNDKQDEMVVGLVAMEDQRNYYIDLGKTQGILPKTECIPNEKIKMGSSIKVYITKVDSNSKGPVILLSRTHYGFVKRLFELEIPEINEGIIMIYSVARDAGNRTKIAVYSENDKVDPVGSCIGERGSRINRIIEELNGEKIDVIPYDKDASKFIANALSPAKDLQVFITDEMKKEAFVLVNDDNLSLAIGKKGSNVKLAARLTHYKIDVKTYEQAKEEGINVLG